MSERTQGEMVWDQRIAVASGCVLVGGAIAVRAVCGQPSLVVPAIMLLFGLVHATTGRIRRDSGFAVLAVGGVLAVLVACLWGASPEEHPLLVAVFPVAACLLVGRGWRAKDGAVALRARVAVFGVVPAVPVAEVLIWGAPAPVVVLATIELVVMVVMAMAFSERYS